MDRPLTALFVDCDSYFASVEQHLDATLRGRAVGVAPVMAESSCCIAASYEAKAFGVKTGTRISEARILCPGIAIVEAKPAEYIRYHHRIVAAVEDCIHVEAVLSIDEMWAWLPYNLRDPATVEAIGRRIKAAVARDVSPVIKVSIGAGPNKYLAKIASKMRKPDGLFLIEHSDLPDILHALNLRDLTGIARSMETRLHAAGIHTVAHLCAVPKPVLRGVWGGVLGERLWHLLRGDEIPDLVSARKSISHSHVLPPDSRAPDRAWPILCKLLHKACERLRAHGLLAGALTLQLAFPGGPSWAAETRTAETDSTLVLLRLLEKLWRERPDPRRPLLQVGVVLTRLCEHGNYTPSLFQTASNATAATDPAKHQRLDAALDQLRARYGRRVVYFGSVQESRDHAPMRISFTHIPDGTLEQD
ncbi:MAG: DNA polymerase [Verrucomicrobia bacterium]|nr:DNA polymerase [Verrucomicrobiota bacterium]